MTIEQIDMAMEELRVDWSKHRRCGLLCADYRSALPEFDKLLDQRLILMEASCTSHSRSSPDASSLLPV